MTFDFLLAVFNFFIFSFVFMFNNFAVCIVSDFKIYWNVNSKTCEDLGISLDLSRYGIIHNEGSVFRSNTDKVWISYGPGRFPFFDQTGSAINGGIPQDGDISDHLNRFKSQLKSGTKEDINGVGILDFEDYFPDHDAAPLIYQTRSLEWARSENPTWTEEQNQEYSKTTFNDASRLFFESLLEEAILKRPGALWGYYHFPYCENYTPVSNKVATCPSKISHANDRMLWLYSRSTAFYPSLYIKGEGSWRVKKTVVNQVKGRMDEAFRLRDLLPPSAPYKPIIPYIWYRYKEAPHKFLTLRHLFATIGTAYNEGADGVVLWDFTASTESECTTLQRYIFDDLGPCCAYYVKKWL